MLTSRRRPVGIQHNRCVRLCLASSSRSPLRLSFPPLCRARTHHECCLSPPRDEPHCSLASVQPRLTKDKGQHCSVLVVLNHPSHHRGKWYSNSKKTATQKPSPQKTERKHQNNKGTSRTGTFSIKEHRKREKIPQENIEKPTTAKTDNTGIKNTKKYKIHQKKRTPKKRERTKKQKENTTRLSARCVPILCTPPTRTGRPRRRRGRRAEGLAHPQAPDADLRGGPAADGAAGAARVRCARAGGPAGRPPPASAVCD